MFNVELDNCWKVWNGMPCAFVALDDGMDWKAFARAEGGMESAELRMGFP